MKRLILIVAMALTCLIAAVANLVIDRVTTFNVFTMKLWFIVPVGAAIVGALGTSGYVLAARLFNIRPKWIDVVPAFLIGAGTMVLIYYLDYLTLVLDDGTKASDVVSFQKYVDILLTTAHMRVGRGAQDVGEVGQFGYVLAGIEFLGFLVGGLFPLVAVLGMPTCADCQSYLRKLKTSVTKPLPPDEAAGVLKLFEESDYPTMQALLAWQPEERWFDKEAVRAIVIYTLYGCPKCKSEMIEATVKVLKKGEWKEVDKMKRRRNLGEGASLRGSFV